MLTIHDGAHKKQSCTGSGGGERLPFVGATQSRNTSHSALSPSRPFRASIRCSFHWRLPFPASAEASRAARRVPRGQRGVMFCARSHTRGTGPRINRVHALCAPFAPPDADGARALLGASESSSMTVTAKATSSSTRSSSATASISASASVTPPETPSNTGSPSVTPSSSATALASNTPSNSPSASNTPSNSPSPSTTPSSSSSSSASPSETATSFVTLVPGCAFPVDAQNYLFGYGEAITPRDLSVANMDLGGWNPGCGVAPTDGEVQLWELDLGEFA